MWVTAYTSTPGELGSSGKAVGLHSVAVANKLWRKEPGTLRGEGEYRIYPDGSKVLDAKVHVAAQPAYPYGSSVKVYAENGDLIYEGTVVDTGRGWIRNGWPSDAWVDLWFSTSAEGIALGIRHLTVEITAPAK
jgi:3D (Asp-Asp-Asp) domain-containing protein